MITEDFNLDEAEAAFAAANTPLYLVRKLKADPAVQAISRIVKPDQILMELERTAGKNPTNLREAVVPFICLVALQMQPSDDFLLRTTKIIPSHGADWFRTIRQVLLETFTPTPELPKLSLPRILSNDSADSEAINQQTVFEVRS